jgi:type IX secretion system PorP/SprF family membrane protein
MIMKKLFVIAIFAISAITAKAQQDILLTQYMFNHLLVNPGYAGSKEYMMATVLYRNQWVGWDNAPTTQVASLHGPLGLTNLGWGGLITHDHEGVIDRTNIYANFAYQLPLNDKLKLGMGLRGGTGIFTRKTPDKFWDVADPAYQDKVTNILPNLGAGLYLHSEKFYAGISAPEVISYDPDRSLSLDIEKEAKEIYNQVRHYFMATGVVVELSGKELMMRPSILAKYTQNAPLEGDFNLMFILNEKVWIGGTYRTGDAVAAILELQLTKQLRLGYSYDFTTTDIKNYSDGSHEIMLGYDFGIDFEKVKTPRYF